MLLWFIGLSFVGAWLAFRSPALDYRLVVVGSVLPLIDAVTGGAWVLHSLVASVAVLVVVMVATRRRRLARRRWLSLPIGMFLHLVLDGAWTQSDMFWWPFLGGDLSRAALPEADRGPGLVVAMELAGAVAIGWCWVRFGLADSARRARFARTGQLDRALAHGGGAGGTRC